MHLTQLFLRVQDAAIANGDAGQQWIIPREAFKASNEDFGKEVLTVEVWDSAGISYGQYFVQIDTEDFATVCANANAAEAQILSTYRSFWCPSLLFYEGIHMRVLSHA